MVASDIPALPYDNYYSWKAGITGSTKYDIMGTQWGSGYTGISFNSVNPELTISAATNVDGSLAFTFDYTGVTGVPNGNKGDITVTDTGSVWTINSDAVTYDKMQDISTQNRLLGRAASVNGTVAELTPSQVRTTITSDITSSEVSFLNTAGGSTIPTVYDYLSSNTAATTSTSAVDSLLNVPLLGGGVYQFEAVIAATSGTGTSGNAFGVRYSGTSTPRAIMTYGTTTTTATKAVKATLGSLSNGFLTSQASTGMIKITGMILPSTNGNLIVTYAAVGTTSCMLLAGSYITVTRVA